MDLCPEFPLQVARYGAKSDFPQARAILERRVRLPAAEVAEANLFLFDAFMERRNGKIVRARANAAEAAKRFDFLQWHGYANLARTLLPDSLKAQHTATIDGRALPEILPDLTLRERQVAELVLKGQSNRAIAEKLSIKERTVEAHMTSIMGHLGVHSRHQFMARFLHEQSE
jgi:DNA-binding CsgD family transcriptional regulator